MDADTYDPSPPLPRNPWNTAGGNWYQVDFGAMTVSEKDVGFSFQPVVADISVYPGLLGVPVVLTCACACGDLA